MTTRVSSSLVPGRSRLAAISILLMLLAPAWVAASETPPEPTAQPSASKAEAEVRLLQAAVAVFGSEEGARRPVAGLEPSQFNVRLDGKRLEPGDGLSIDDFCLGAGERAAGAPRRPVLIFADFNYLDAAGRAEVAAALEEVAARIDSSREGESFPFSYKVFAIARGVRELTDGFTADPEALRGVAQQIRRTSYRQGPGAGPEGRQGELMAELFRSDLVGENQPAENPSDGNVELRMDASQPTGFSTRPATDGSGQEYVERIEDGAPGKATTLAAAMQRSSSRNDPDLNNQGAQSMDSMVNDSSLLRDTRQTQAELDAAAGYDAMASVEAIRAVLLAHQSIPGRKGVVLYSSDAFDIAREERLQAALDRLRPLLNGMYVFWGADAAGLSPQSDTTSPLLSSLAADSGGGSLRRSADLAAAIESAEQSLSCYYLVSVRVPASDAKEKEHRLTVDLDTRRFPDLWGARVTAPSGMAHLRWQDVRSNRRTAALLVPDQFEAMNLQTTLDGPYWSDGDPLAVVQARVPLAQLGKARPDGMTRLWLDMVVSGDDADHAEPVCRYTTPEDRPILVSGTIDPLRREHGELVIDLPCPLRRSGAYTATVVLTDLDSEQIAAARDRTRLTLSPLQIGSGRIARLVTHTPADIVWNPGRRWATPFTAWPIWRLRDEDREIGLEEEVVIRYLTCPEDASQRGWLLRWSGDGQPQLTEVKDLRHVKVKVGSELLAMPGCATRAVSFPAHSLEPGEYRFILADPGTATSEILAANATPQPKETSPRAITFHMLPKQR